MAKHNLRKSEIKARKDYFNKLTSQLEPALKFGARGSVLKKMTDELSDQKILFFTACMDCDFRNLNFGSIFSFSNINTKIGGTRDLVQLLMAGMINRLATEFKTTPEKMLGEIVTKMSVLDEVTEIKK